MKCPLCGNKLTLKIDEVYYECKCCAALVMNSEYYLSRDDEKTRYEKHNNDVNDVGYKNFTSPITNYILNNYTYKDKGLDYGCGPGPVISTTLMENNYDVDQYDPFFRPDSKLYNNYYNYIICCEVFEHFRNPRNEIIKLKYLLKPNGKLLIMTFLYNHKIDFQK